MPGESVERFVERLVAEKADGVMLGAMFGNGELTYTSSLRPRREAHDPDWLRRVMPALRDAGLNVHCWLSFNVQDVHDPEDLVPARQYPQWRMRFAPPGEGDSTHVGMCLTCSPYFDRYAELLKEIAGFGFDHYWFDGFYLAGTPHPVAAGCWCEHCRQAFEAETDLPMPETVDWSSDAFCRWVRWRNDRLFDASRRCLRLLRKVQPDAQCTVNTNTWPMFSHKGWETAVPLWRWDDEIGVSQHAYAWDIRSKWITMGFKARLAHDMSPGHADIWRADLPKATCGSGAFDPTWHELEITLWLLLALSTGVRPWHYADERDPLIGRATAAAHEAVRVREHTFTRDAVATTAVLVSQNTHDFRCHGQGLGRDDYRDSILGTWLVLQAAHLPHRLIFDNQLTPNQLRGIDTLVLPDTQALSGSACDAIEAWVKAGGHLIASGRTACSNEWGLPWGIDPPALVESLVRAPSGRGSPLGAGWVTRFESDPGRAYCRERDHSQAEALNQAVRRAVQPIEVQGSPWLLVSPMIDASGRLLVHLLNGSPFFPNGDCGFRGVGEIAGPQLSLASDAHADGARDARGGPLRPIDRIRIRVPGRSTRDARLAIRGESLTADRDGWIQVRGLELHDVLTFASESED